MKNYFKLMALILALSGLTTSCGILNDDASSSISMNDLALGMDKQSILAKFGEPFAFDLYMADKDTVTVLYYKATKSVSGRGVMVTTQLSFVNDRLEKIAQGDDSSASGRVILCNLPREPQVNHPIRFEPLIEPLK
jgi:hypothetical protein